MDQAGDTKVHALWHLRAELARSRRVVYSKWFKNRATLFAKSVFRAMLGDLRARGDLRGGLGHDARALLDLLEGDSPVSTKALRKASGLADAPFQAGLKALWSRLLVVGVGEVDDGAFPSLEIGATRLLFEEEWSGTSAGSTASEARALAAALEGQAAFARELERVRRAIGGDAPFPDTIYGSLTPSHARRR